jgi:hypothetical protein
MVIKLKFELNSNKLYIFFLLATPFNVKNHQQSKKFNTHTPTNMNYATPLQQHSLTNDQWTGLTTSTIPSNHLAMQTQHQQSRVINNMQPIPLQHQQPINNK